MVTNATSVDNEPEPKRKTLVERAGEPRSIAAATPSARPVMKGTSLASAGVSFFFSSNISFPSAQASFHAVPMAPQERQQLKDGVLDIPDQSLEAIVRASFACIYYDDTGFKLLKLGYQTEEEPAHDFEYIILHLEWQNISSRVGEKRCIKKRICLKELNAYLIWPALYSSINQIAPSHNEVWELHLSTIPRRPPAFGNLSVPIHNDHGSKTGRNLAWDLATGHFSDFLLDL